MEQEEMDQVTLSLGFSLRVYGGKVKRVIPTTEPRVEVTFPYMLRAVNWIGSWDLQDVATIVGRVDAFNTPVTVVFPLKAFAEASQSD